MRMFEECPYITPCGFCSRKGEQCTHDKRKPSMPRVDLHKQITMLEETKEKAFFGEERQEGE
jgi:hypothetical protein